MAVELKHTVAKIKNQDGTWEGIPALKGENVYDVAVRNGFVGTEDELVEQMLSDGWVTRCIKLDNEKADADRVYNKTEVLTDTTRALYGLGAEALPDDILASLSKFESHAWLKESTKKQYALKTDDVTATIWLQNGVSSDTAQRIVYYGESISVDSNGKISIPNAITGYICYSGYANGHSNAILKGKYFTLDNSVFYYAVSEVLDRAGYDSDHKRDNYYTWVQARLVYSEQVDDGSTEYVYSRDRGAYPENGTLGSFTYAYLGTALTNAINGLHYKIGSYIGTGVCGPNYPNKLTFDFVPKIVVVFEPEGGIEFVYAGQTGTENRENTKTDYMSFSVTGKTLSWYNGHGAGGGAIAENSPKFQHNEAGLRYFYFALG